MALRVQPDHPPRADALDALLDQKFAGMLAPCGHGVGGDSYYVICPAPPGPSLARNPRPWGEAELLACLIRPAALALAQLEALGQTHRAIRPNNIFQARPGAPVVLGAAWAGPPAALQSAVFEPPYMAQCLPSGRGNGVIADDIYALGAVMLALARGETPMAGMDETAILLRKLELGSLAALLGDARVPGLIADLARGMLAEDPAHRLSPEMLAEPLVARARRVTTRQDRGATRPLVIGRISAGTTRTVALAMARDPAAATDCLRGDALETWLRRARGDNTLATSIEDAKRMHLAMSDPGEATNAAYSARVIALLDPLAPPCWQGISVWPDGIGPALAAARDEPTIAARLTALIRAEGFSVWASARATRTDDLQLRREAARLRTILDTNRARTSPGPATGELSRLRYELNPLVNCASPLLRGHWVTDAASLLPALEAVAGQAEFQRDLPIDTEIAAFIATRARHREERDAAADPTAARSPRTALRLYASLQARYHADRPLPGLARWLHAHATPLIDAWQERPRRIALRQQLGKMVEHGQLLPMFALLEDEAAHDTDARNAAKAAARQAEIDQALHDIAQSGQARAEIARRLGQELATGAGLAGLVGMLATLALR